jgi:hypothetical protein
MKEFGWNTEYMSWSQYREALLEGKGEIWDALEQADLVFGGMDFSCDFL